MKCLWFCYFKLIQSELDRVKCQWNSHYIRQSRHETIPGVPDILYYLPENTGGVDCLVPVPQNKIEEVEPQCELTDTEDSDYHDYFQHIMEFQILSYPTNAEEAFNLFQHFKNLQNEL